MEELRQKILQKSGSMFLWVKLVVPILNNLYHRGAGVAIMTKVLERMPDDLHNLKAFITDTTFRNQNSYDMRVSSSGGHAGSINDNSDGDDDDDDVRKIRYWQESEKRT